MEHVHHPQGDPMVISLQKQAPSPRPIPQHALHHAAPPPPHTSAPKKSPRDVRRMGAIALAMLAALVIFVSIYRAATRTDVSTSVSEATTTRTKTPVDLKDTADVVAHIGTLIRLPEGEQPTVATVSNLDPLKGQAFFEHARIGDVVLMYAQAKKAILYNPQEDRIVEVAPIVAE